MQVVVGKRGVEAGTVDVKMRASGERAQVPLDGVALAVRERLESARVGGAMAGVPKDLRRFLEGRRDVEAVLQRVGHATYDVVFVDGGGEWTHWVVESEEAAASLAEAAGAPLHIEWTEPLSRRVNDGNPWADPKGQRRAL